jgi:hypothetical protein
MATQTFSNMTADTIGREQFLGVRDVCTSLADRLIDDGNNNLYLQ